MAAKFTMRPAKVTRENTKAPIGSSAISAHADAANSAAGARSQGDVGKAPAIAGMPTRMPSVAPNVSANPASTA